MGGLYPRTVLAQKRTREKLETVQEKYLPQLRITCWMLLLKHQYADRGAYHIKKEQ